MTTKNYVLEILLNKAPAYISGEEMAKKLQVSRTAIWKAVNQLKKEGHQIISSTNKGYLYIPDDILSKEGIVYYLKKTTPKLTIQVTKEVDSTNKVLKLAAIRGAADNTVLVTNKQTATKGRFGRDFFAADEKGIYFSFLLHPDPNLIEPTQYTLITAVAISHAIEKITQIPVSVKWVNDLYINDKKVCGILSEALSDFETNTISSIIIGIGINFSIPQDSFPNSIKKKAGSIFSTQEPTCSRNQLIGEILNQFYQLLQELPEKHYLEEYRKRSFVIGKEVSFTYHDHEQTGQAIDIGNKGELIVLLENQEKISLSSGEISLKKIY